MSYQIYIQKFENGDSVPIPFNEISIILSSYGEIVEGYFGLEFISNIGEICDDLSLSGNRVSGIFGITFDRPTTHEKLPEIIFQLLRINNTCFFGSDLKFVQTRSEMEKHYPPILIEGLLKGPEKITTERGSWPLK